MAFNSVITRQVLGPGSFFEWQPFGDKILPKQVSKELWERDSEIILEAAEKTGHVEKLPRLFVKS